jgi:hypothetical protein
VLVGGQVVDYDVQLAAGIGGGDLPEEARNSWWRWRSVHASVTRAETKSSDDPLAWAYITVRRLRHDAQRHRLVGGRTAGSL